MNLVRMVQFINLVWVLSEISLIVFTRRNQHSARPRDRGSRTLLWIAIGAGIAAGTALQSVSRAAMPVPESRLLVACMFLLLAGLAIRWTAILTLGRFFTTNVNIHNHHRLVRTGLFRLVRHPSYTGLILLVLGMALSFGNWLSFAAVMIPFLTALLYRIHVEEASLAEALGNDYAEYSRATKRLFPGIY